MPDKLKVGVAFGGPSPEHDISKNSGRNVCINIDSDKFDVFPIYITRDGLFQISAQPSQQIETAFTQPACNSASSVNALKAFNVVFNTIHGPYGEDGTFHAFLQVLGVKCTGSSHSSSALAMDKMRSRMVLNAHGIPTPHSVYLTNIHDQMPFMPTFIKPNAQGSSVGVSAVRSEDKLRPALDLAFSYGDIVIAEELLEGQEITCAILERKCSTPEALPVTLIVPKTSDFFDIKAKYEIGASDEITPAPIPEESFKLAQSLALRTHTALDCSGVTRVDMFLLPDGQIKVLEINTLPGMTDTSLVPQAAKCVGISFTELLTIIIEAAS
jgi:D-alanine-D-alanine ligase